jgi:hypothetical protein
LVGLGACELACAVAYNNCLANTEDELEANLVPCQDMCDIDERDKCIDNAMLVFNLGGAMCATEYALCGLSCLLPFNPGWFR